MQHLGAYEYYFRPRIDRRSSGLGLNVAVCPPFEQHPVHAHETPGIIVILQGDYIEDFGSKSTVLPPLTARFRPALAPHSHRTGPAGATALHLEFSDDWLEQSNRDDGDLSQFRIAGQDHVARRSIKLLIELAARQTAPNPEWPIEALTVFEAVVNSDIQETRTPTWLTQAKQYLDDKHKEPIKLNNIASDVGISPMHLASTFRKRYGCSIIEYTTQKRLETAATLILKGWPAGIAGVEAGFYDHAYFTRTFKRAFGDRPSLLALFERSRMEEPCDPTSPS